MESKVLSVEAAGRAVGLSTSTSTRVPGPPSSSASPTRRWWRRSTSIARTRSG